MNPPRFRTLHELAARLPSEPDLQKAIREDPVGALSRLAEPLRSDVWIYRIVVTALGLVVLTTVTGAIILAMSDRNAPEILVAIGSAAVGALAGLLAPSPSGTR